MRHSPDHIDAAIGANIRTARRLHGLSQADLADALGITFQQVQKYENGKNRVSASMLARTAVVFAMPVATFFDGVPSEAR